MDDQNESGAGYGGAANKLVKLLTDTAGLLIEPAKIRRVAAAKADEIRIVTGAEIEREDNLSNARYRLEVMELRREKNLQAVAKILTDLKGPDFSIEDQDLLVDFVESCKDTSDPTLQDIWARLLAGEMESKGNCSKRTLHMVKSLSRDEALLIKSVCRRVCFVEEADSQRIAFLGIVINRLKHEFGEDQPNVLSLYREETEGRRQRDERLIACGFLSSEDYKFSFHGDGYLDVERFRLSDASPKKIIMGEKALVAEEHQPGLLQEPRKSINSVRLTTTPAASIEFDAWKLSPEGNELYRALNEEPDYSVLGDFKNALDDGGLSIREA